jgi:hypothetical protein
VTGVASNAGKLKQWGPCMNISVTSELERSRRTVEELVYAGESENFLAKFLELTLHELHLQYGDALTNGQARRRAEVIAMLFEAARNGDCQAILRLEELGRTIRNM